MSVARVTEIKASSTKSFEDAVQSGVARASKTLKNIKTAWIQNQEVIVGENGKILEYRVKRMTPLLEKNPHAIDNRPFKPKAPAPKTLHNEIVTLRMVLKSALRRQLIEGLPDLSAPFRGNGKISHRPWFSLGEYKQLYTATRENKKRPSGRPLPSRCADCQSSRMNVTFRWTRYSEILPFSPTMTS